MTNTFDDITCPVSPQRVNENVVRTVAVFVLMIATLSLYLNLYVLSAFLAVDFAIRAFTDGRASLLKNISKYLVQVLKIGERPIDAAPKKFAAGVGALFSISISLLQIFHFPYAAYAVGGILFICAFLEGFVGFCVGCVIYSYGILAILNKIK
ncbi:MAG: DUF4395 domain-containing protein [Cytophagales bacterium]|nr:DUF4395 domain-containing protein [Cytophagales bacterium]